MKTKTRNRRIEKESSIIKHFGYESDPDLNEITEKLKGNIITITSFKNIAKDIFLTHSLLTNLMNGIKVLLISPSKDIKYFEQQLWEMFAFRKSREYLRSTWEENTKEDILKAINILLKKFNDTVLVNLMVMDRLLINSNALNDLGGLYSDFENKLNGLDQVIWHDIDTIGYFTPKNINTNDKLIYDIQDVSNRYVNSQGKNLNSSIYINSKCSKYGIYKNQSIYQFSSLLKYQNSIPRIMSNVIVVDINSITDNLLLNVYDLTETKLNNFQIYFYTYCGQEYNMKNLI